MTLSYLTLQAGLMSGGKLLCTGSVVHPRYLLTSATCLLAVRPNQVQHILYLLYLSNTVYVQYVRKELSE